MIRRRVARAAVPLLFTAGLLAARLTAAPALSDPVAGAAPAGLRLDVPWLYIGLAPLFTLWDGVSMLSMSRLRGLLLGLALLYLLWRGGRAAWRGRLSWRHELAAFAITLALFAAFVVTGALWHRPMLALDGTGRDDVVVDFHSHTNASHDVRDTWMHGFDAEANRRWHARAGFDAAFITDHNTPSRDDTARRPALCAGIEVSAWRAHVVLLGGSLPVDRGRYNSSLDELLGLLRGSETAYGALSVASLPEYERNHWGRLDRLVAAGLDGFEVVNAAPRANELTRARRDSVIALARRHGHLAVGVSDSHGWGATSMVWNLVHVPGWRGRPGEVCAAVLRELRRGLPAVRVVERHRLRADAGWPQWLTPLGVVWETWRGMGWPLAAAWLVWVWGLYALHGVMRSARGGSPAGVKTARYPAAGVSGQNSTSR